MVVPIHSVARADHMMEGTRLTLVRVPNQPDAYEFSIRTPVTPPRWKDFDAELEAAFEGILAAFAEGAPEAGRGAGHKVATPPRLPRCHPRLPCRSHKFPAGAPPQAILLAPSLSLLLALNRHTVTTPPVHPTLPRPPCPPAPAPPPAR